MFAATYTQPFEEYFEVVILIKKKGFIDGCTFICDDVGSSKILVGSCAIRIGSCAIRHFPIMILVS